MLSVDNITKIDVLCGLSRGGVIAYSFWKNIDTEVTNLILDGAPLAPFPKIVENVMKRSYTDIIRKSKARDNKTLSDFKKQFLPEKYLEDYLKIADRMSSESAKNLISAVSGDQLDGVKKTDTRIFSFTVQRAMKLCQKEQVIFLKKSTPKMSL